MSASAAVSPGRLSTLRNLARAAFTVPPFLACHVWRRRRVDNVTRTVERLAESAPTASSCDHSGDGATQTAAVGHGPLVLRSYEVRIERAELSPEELMQRLIERPGRLNDDRIAGFVRDDRPATDLGAGDEFVVELPGPWNGPVRVTRADSTELLLETLDGHMEAGQIRFDTTDHCDRPDGAHDYTFRIRSWARGGDPAFTILHLGIRAAKELQTAMWVAMCDGAVRVSRGRRFGRIAVLTEVLANSSPDDNAIGGILEKVGGR